MRRLLAAAIFLAATAAARASAPGIVIASIYGPRDSGGQVTSTGRRIDPNALTCAHKELPFGTRLVLHHGRNSAEVVITDRGPFVGGRNLDCTPAVDRALHLGGLGRVRVEFWPPLPKPNPRVTQ